MAPPMKLTAAQRADDERAARLRYLDWLATLPPHEREAIESGRYPHAELIEPDGTEWPMAALDASKPASSTPPKPARSKRNRLSPDELRERQRAGGRQSGIRSRGKTVDPTTGEIIPVRRGHRGQAAKGTAVALKGAGSGSRAMDL